MTHVTQDELSTWDSVDIHNAHPSDTAVQVEYHCGNTEICNTPMELVNARDRIRAVALATA